MLKFNEIFCTNINFGDTFGINGQIDTHVGHVEKKSRPKLAQYIVNGRIPLSIYASALKIYQ